MIKINLLDSVSERKGGTVVAVERKIGSPVSRLILMMIATVFLFVAVVSIDVISSQWNKRSAENALEEQKQISAQLEVVLKEQKELEQKINNIDLRIDAIKKLRSEQAGPSAVLDSVVERIVNTPGLYLESIVQTGNELVITGNSPDESIVTQFGRRLEFSGGLFSNLNIETQRKASEGQTISANPDAPPVLDVVGFTIRCNYTPDKGGNPDDSTTAANDPQGATPASNGAVPPANGANPPQVAKN
jgi:Tfp pilus assembly protein PilN